jgi:hypothetical protein
MSYGEMRSMQGKMAKILTALAGHL